MVNLDFKRTYELIKWLDEALKIESIPFNSIKASQIPSEGGIYFISDISQDNEEIIYIGLTSNLSQRVYGNQFQGDKTSSQIKNAIIDHGRAKDMETAKEYLSKSCTVRYSVVPDFREREMKEGFAIAIIKPQFSTYKSKEH